MIGFVVDWPTTWPGSGCAVLCYIGIVGWLSEWPSGWLTRWLCSKEIDWQGGWGICLVIGDIIYKMVG